MPLTTGAQPKSFVAGAPIRLPLIEGNDIRFTHLSTEQGLSQSRVDHMLQDRRGFIWIGTYNGLNRFDGYRFQVYKPDPNNPNSLGGALVLPLFEDQSGILWIGVDAGLDRFDPTTERFTHFRIDPNNPDSPSGEVEHITQDRDGMLWVATHNGLDRLDPASGRFTHYRHDPGDPNTLSSSDVRFLLEDRQGVLWVATSAGIDTFDRRTGRVLRRYPTSQQPPLDRILEDRSGTLWLSATRGGGIASLDPKTGVFTRYVWFERPETPGARGCSDILEDRHGMLWLATNPDGVIRFDRARRLFTRYRNNPVDPASLNNNDTLSLLEDREGGIWVGTSGAGVNRFPSKPPPFTTYRREPGNANSLDEENVLSVLEDSQGILWIGTRSRLNRLDRKTGRYTFYRHDPANPESIATGTVRAMVEDRAGFLWFGTWGGGLNRLDRGTGRFKAYRHDPADAATLSNDYVLSLLIDHNGNLWAGTDDGLNRLEARTGRFTVFRPKSGPIESRWYRVLAEGADGSIWMGTYTQGLQRLDVRTGEIVEYKNDPKVRGSLSNNRVNALCVDHRGTLWVGTQNGLNRFDRNTGEFTTFGERDGLSNNAVEGILEDSAGNLWLSTGNGLSKFNPRTRTFKNYYSDDGLAGDEFNDFSVYYKSASGEMFFGGVNGVTAFFPEKLVDRLFVPPVVLTDFRLFNDPVPVGGRSPLKKSISYTDSLTLSHAQNIFALEFSALSFANPTRTRYRYRLDGLETQWNERTATHRLVTYTTLPAGEYRFLVQSKDNRGGWSEPGLTLAIRVLPAWWNTWQFRTVWITSLLLLTWIVYRFRVRQLQRAFRRLQDVIDTIPAYVWSALPDGSVDFINRRWLDFSGYSLEQGLGWGWAKAVHPEDRDRFMEAWRTAFTSGQAMETEARVRRADGQYRWLLIRNVPLHDKTGKIVKWYGESTDIDDRKRAEEALRQSEAYLAEAQTLSHTGSWAFDVAGNRYIYASEECLRIFGLDPQGALPTREVVYQLIHGDDSERVNRGFEKSVREKVTTSDEFRIVLSDGAVRHVHVIRHAVLNDAGEVVKLVGTAADITERKRAEEDRERLRHVEVELAHINRVNMMGELSASIAHEVNQPLTGIVSNGSACLRFLAGDAPNLEEARDAVRDIVRDGNRAGEVIARIRALTKRTAPRKEKLDLNETIRDVLVLVGDEAKRKSVVIGTRFADDLFPVSGDRVQLQQVVLNLVVNGIEAMSGLDEGARQLAITTRNIDEGQVQVIVQDSGTGIDPNTMGKIFDPFYTTKPGGMGMGLSICLSIVQSHGGRLWATANNGPGTSFHFTLPKHYEPGSHAGVGAA
jgi:PAS domain S-box-containing protein